MSDHYHYASEVQGAADDNHGHSPRDIGAAEEHDLNMLERRVLRAEAGVAELERSAGSEVNGLKRRVAELEAGYLELQGQFAQLQRMVLEAAGNSTARLNQFADLLEGRIA
jgi:hypothetical protein